MGSVTSPFAKRGADRPPGSAEVTEIGLTVDAVDKVVQLSVTDSSGEWVPPDLLQDAALAAWRKGVDVTVSLESMEHLDASALQILLALAAALERDAHKLRLINPTAVLERWFHLAGATALLPPIPNEVTPAEVY